MSAGKGDSPRPVDPVKYGDGWERIWGNRGSVMRDKYHPDDVKLRDHGKHSKKRK